MKLKKLERQLRSLYLDILKFDNNIDKSYIKFLENVTSDKQLCYFDVKRILDYISKINKIYERNNEVLYVKK